MYEGESMKKSVFGAGLAVIVLGSTLAFASQVSEGTSEFFYAPHTGAMSVIIGGQAAADLRGKIGMKSVQRTVTTQCEIDVSGGTACQIIFSK
jgi:hypothetical protein